MLVEGTMRWQVTEDAPMALMLALAFRDMAGLGERCVAQLPAVTPGLERVDVAGLDLDALAVQFDGWWTGIVRRDTRLFMAEVGPPHFEVFDRALDLQELAYRAYDEAHRWASARIREYERALAGRSPSRLTDVYELIRERQFELRRQSSSFRLDLEVLPICRPGAWVVAPDTIVVSESLRDDREAFREWLRPLVHGLV
ncbi:hypothetical protein [Plantibacter sp. VKM Ac-2876]|uniref:hypothetical protein n=1 Tax=Plantibacter sp. VKM Ac-2876 TaxID=2783826 RepID=UPI00188D5C93|nr:hypothetical protein [Plantibacter sp. VKM Ac-2876]MBF4565259.1 hypothetical protein [Plantibacter sp. VKM Ac-2876]